jgi:hypothetical protein
VTGAEIGVRKDEDHMGPDVRRRRGKVVEKRLKNVEGFEDMVFTIDTKKKKVSDEGPPDFMFPIAYFVVTLKTRRKQWIGDC